MINKFCNRLEHHRQTLDSIKSIIQKFCIKIPSITLTYDFFEFLGRITRVEKRECLYTRSAARESMNAA